MIVPSVAPVKAVMNPSLLPSLGTSVVLFLGHGDLCPNAAAEMIICFHLSVKNMMREGGTHESESESRRYRVHIL